MDGSGYLDWLLATQGVNTHACIGKVNGHGRVLYKQAMRLLPRAQPTRGLAVSEAAKATAMADAAEAMPEVANARGKRVFRLSMRSTSQPDTANYAAIRLHKNVWQLSGEAGSRIAVFATPLALARRPQSVKRWRTRLFLSGCENSGLDERTGGEVEAIVTDDNIIEFSHI